MAMVLAVGATAVHPRLAIELAAELAGSRGAEALTPTETVGHLIAAFEAGLRKTLARMGISAVASYIGGALIDVVDLDASVVARCFPTAAAWPGRTTLADLADRQIRRRAAALAIPEPAAGREPRLPDPGFARFRADGEAHLFSPKIAGEITLLSVGGVAGGPGVAGSDGSVAPTVDEALARYRAALARPATDRAVPRDELRIRAAAVADAARRGRGRPLDRAPLRGLGDERRRAQPGGPPGADHRHPAGRRRGQHRRGRRGPGLVRPGPRRPTPRRPDQAGRLGTVRRDRRLPRPRRPARDQDRPGLEAGRGRPAARAQGDRLHRRAASRPARPELHQPAAAPRHLLDRGPRPAHRRPARDQPGRRGSASSSSPSRGVGTIAAGVAKAGASYIHLSGHAGGTGASPLSSIKHVGAPWELGLAEVHQVLLRNDLRDRVVLRTDGGLQTGRDLIVAALLGAEEFAFGTAALVAIGCDMARQCHLDTCPTGIATQREDLRAKFAGTPDDVVRFFTAIAEDLRRELAAVGARSVGEIVGESRRLLHATPAARAELAPVIGATPWPATAARRANPTGAGGEIGRAPASSLEVGIAAAFRGQGSVTATGLRLTTADRSFGAGLTGALERGELHGPIRLDLRGAAGQSFGAFAGPGVELRLVGQANDYVAKGLSGGSVTVVPEPDLGGRGVIRGDRRQHRASTARPAGRLHLVGRAGMRFAVRNSGAEAVVEGIGPHGCEYMTGGTVVVLGPVGANFGAGMTGGRAYLYDPTRPPHRRARRSQRRGGPARLGPRRPRRRPGPRHRAHPPPRGAPRGRFGPRRPAPRRGRSRGALLAGRAGPGRSGGGRRRGATRPQPYRSRLDADARDGQSYARSNMGQRHLRVRRPWPIPQSTRKVRPDDPPLRPRDPAHLSRPRRRDGPVTCAACGCRLSATGDAFIHFNPIGGRDARGCRVACADAAHDTSGRPISVPV